jgi:hypothetical protein
MAAIFYQAINEAIADGAIVAPEDFTISSPVCDKVAGTGRDAGGYTQRGSGYGDGIYYHDSVEEGVSTHLPFSFSLSLCRHPTAAD